MSEPLNVQELQRWIGTEDTAQDDLTPALAQRFHATFPLDGDAPNVGEAAPRLIHFCLCQPAASMTALGKDGHPARGGFLPPVPLPRRMWAGSSVAFHGDLRVGDTVQRLSRIADVVVKQGTSGILCFVTVDHSFMVDGQLRIEDRQTIVYRTLQNAPAAAAPAAPVGETVCTVDPSSTLLFRYSALTFNGHRIHYDAPYATGIEGYPGLVVHGPLQATLLLQLAARVGRRAPDAFQFRSLSTLYDTDRLFLNSGTLSNGTLALWTGRANGPVAMRAEARWR